MWNDMRHWHVAMCTTVVVTSKQRTSWQYANGQLSYSTVRTCKLCNILVMYTVCFIYRFSY